jgi:hypothetical protein
MIDAKCGASTPRRTPCWVATAAFTSTPTYGRTCIVVAQAQARRGRHGGVRGARYRVHGRH